MYLFYCRKTGFFIKKNLFCLFWECKNRVSNYTTKFFFRLFILRGIKRTLHHLNLRLGFVFCGLVHIVAAPCYKCQERNDLHIEHKTGGSDPILTKFTVVGWMLMFVRHDFYFTAAKIREPGQKKLEDWKIRRLENWASLALAVSILKLEN